MPKFTRFLGPLTTQRFKTPTGPLKDVGAGFVYDFTRQRDVFQEQFRNHTAPRPMNADGGAAHAIVGSIDYPSYVNGEKDLVK